MRRFTKRLIVLCTAILLALGLCAFAACGDSEEGGNGDTYTITVTVLNPDGTPNTGAMVQICEVEDNGELIVCWNPEKVNAQGVSVQTTHNLKPVEVHLMSIEGYKYDSVILDKDHTSATITLREDDGLETYTVTVNVPEGYDLTANPLSVKLTGNTDSYTETVSADGVATFNIPAANYTCEIANVPSGYSATFGELTATNRTATITLTASAS